MAYMKTTTYTSGVNILATGMILIKDLGSLSTTTITLYLM